MDLESVSDFFLGEDLEKKAGRTMEMMMAPGNTGLWGVADSRKNGLSLQGTVRGIQRTPSVSLFCSWRTGNCFSSCCSVLLLTVTASSHNSINSDQVAVEYRNRTVKAGVTTKTTLAYFIGGRLCTDWKGTGVVLLESSTFAQLCSNWFVRTNVSTNKAEKKIPTDNHDSHITGARM